MQQPSDLNGCRKGESIDEYRQRYLRSLPIEIREQCCRCTPSVASWHKTAAASPNGLVYDWRNGVPYHWDCGKPIPNWIYVEACFSCEVVYLVQTYPDKMLLCEDCGG